MTRRFLIEDIHIPYREDSPEALARAVQRAVGHRVGPAELVVWRRSLDSRAKGNIHFSYSVLVDSPGRARARQIDVDDVVIPEISGYRGPRPVVVGFGPAGIFAAYFLAKAGLKPRIFERGPAMDERVAAVTAFWKRSDFDGEGNVQFGEGGAGTFSDGKLTSRSKDPVSRKIREVLVEFGANPDIVSAAKPHIGTDKLRRIIPAIRAAIERMGGEVRFGMRLEALEVVEGRLRGLRFANGERVGSDAVFLGIGHSARDTFAKLLAQGVTLEPKPFAVGMRVEHAQSVIDEAIYGTRADLSLLPTAEYVLTHEVAGRGCYSFCMCPGGQVVNASSESDGLVVNGMSLSQRGSPWANAALVTSVKVEDFFQGSPLDGVEFQRRIERAAFAAGKNQRGPALAPACDLTSFLEGREPSGGLPRSSFRPGLTPASLGSLFPHFVRETIAAALPQFERSLRGFASSNPLLIAPETRTSSPVRICRRPETGESVSMAGLFPIGEGAGYAGGIVSAAIDGWRAAERWVSAISN